MFTIYFLNFLQLNIFLTHSVEVIGFSFRVDPTLFCILYVRIPMPFNYYQKSFVEIKSLE